MNYLVLGKGGGGKRGEISWLTHASLMKMAFTAHNTAVQFDVMVTLTYPKLYPSDGRAVKRHLELFLRWAKRTGAVTSYFWFLEFQRRGAPHFHIFTSGGNLLGMKKKLSKRWYEIVGSGDEKHLLAGTRTERLLHPEAAGRYAARYASKPYQKKIPPDYVSVGRWWGCSQDVRPQPIAEKEIDSWDELLWEIREWDYAYTVSRKRPMSTLFNAGKIILEKLENENENIQLEP